MSITLIIIIATVVISLATFNNGELRYKATFYPYNIKRSREWYRFITSGFLHNDWIHLGVNMFVLFSFGPYLEAQYEFFFGSKGKIVYVLFYLAAIALANVTTYFKHQDNDYYRSLGASGAISAVVFAFIFFNPSQKLIFIFLPIPINAVIMGVLYLVYSFYMSRRGGDNINHDAHMYGALFGFVLNVVLFPGQLPVFWQQLLRAFGLG